MRAAAILVLSLAPPFLWAQAPPRPGRRPAGDLRGLPGRILGPKEFRVTATILPRLYPRPGWPYPVMVRIANPMASLEGSLEAWHGNYQDANVVCRKLKLGPGRFRFFLYPLIAGSGRARIHVRLLDRNGRSRISQELLLPKPPWTRNSSSRGWHCLVGVVTARDRPLNLAKLTAPRSKARSETAELIQVDIRDASHLPDRWYGYQQFAALLWDGRITEPLDNQQRRALRRWLSAGGRLVLAAKAGDGKLKSPLPGIVPDLELEERREPDSGNEREFFHCRQFPASAGQLYSEKQFGLGQVVLLRVDFASLAKWPRTHDVWGLFGLPVGLPRTTPEWAVRARLISERRQELAANIAKELKTQGGYTAPLFVPILIMGLIYIIVVALGDYLLLRAFRKLPWTWLSFPILIGVFSVISYTVFYKGKLGETRRFEYMIRDLDSTGRFDRQFCFTCIRQNSHEPTRLQVGVTNLIRPWQPGTKQKDKNPRQDEKVLVRTTVMPGAQEVLIPGLVGSFRYFTDIKLGAGSPASFQVELSARSGGALLEGKITKESSYPLRSAFAVYRDKLYIMKLEKLKFRGRGRPLAQLLDKPKSGPGGSLGDYALNDLLINRLFPARTGIASPFRQSGATGTMAKALAQGHAVFFTVYDEPLEKAGWAEKRRVCLRQVVPVLTERE